MKTGLTVKKECALILAALCLLTVLSGCGINSFNKDVRAFIKAEGGFNADFQNAMEKYGSVMDHLTADYMDGSSDDLYIYYTGDDVVVISGNGGYCLRYGDVWYTCTVDAEGVTEYGQAAVFDENYDYNEMYGAPEVVFDDQNNLDAAVTENADGTFVWTGYLNAEGGGRFDMRVSVNGQYEMTETEVSYYTEDGTRVNTLVNTLTYGETDDVAESLLKGLAAALDAAGGATRHVTIHAVENGEVVENYEADVPEGFTCFAVFPNTYYDPEDGLVYYTDAGLTQKLTDPDYNADIEVYVNAAAAE